MVPEVTAVITTHRRPAAVYEALASVRAETYPDIDVVLIDDSSGSGVGAARNRGLAAARGKYIILLDDDDVAMPGRIAQLTSAAEEQQATLCFGMTRRVIDGKIETLADVPTHLKSAGTVGFCDLLACAPHVNAVLARTDALRAAGGFDSGADHFDDWSAWLRMADRGATMWCITESVADWRIHDEGLSGQLLRGDGMKRRILSLFERLSSCLSDENARAIAAATRVVRSSRIITYDDYADAMAHARDLLQSDGSCFCGPLYSRPLPVSDALASHV